MVLVAFVVVALVAIKLVIVDSVEENESMAAVVKLASVLKRLVEVALVVEALVAKRLVEVAFRATRFSR